MGNIENIGFKPFLIDKTVVITGASSGIGRATAIEFAKNGANLVLAARREDMLKEVAAECEAFGVRAMAVKTDVTDAVAMKQLAEAAEAFGGLIDIWVNNAGVGTVGEFTETPIKAHERVIETNLMGHLHGAHAVLPIFKRQRYGVLINVISVGAWVALPYSVSYAASKFGLRGFSEALRGELIKFKQIHICDVFPAFIDTPGFQHGGNYIGRKIKPIPPVYDARRVAGKIVSLAIRPKKAVTVGGSAAFMRLVHFLFPNATKALLATLTTAYFKRAQEVPTSDGSLFNSVSDAKGIDGGWRSSGSVGKSVITGSLVVAGVVVSYFLIRKGLKKSG